MSDNRDKRDQRDVKSKRLVDHVQNAKTSIAIPVISILFIPVNIFLYLVAR
jgi:hypothetical protein